jgi:hypothetical protein
MNCPVCGEVCRCHMEPPPTALPRWNPDAENASAPSLVSVSDARSDANSPGGEAPACETPEASPEDGSVWRDELSARLSRYRARRKVRPPRYPSLSLQFDAVEPSVSANVSSASRAPAFETVSNQALALDGARREPSATADVDVHAQRGPAPEPTRPRVAHASAKIIEFPKFAWGPPSQPPDQLAEPVGAPPRILEVPEVAPPAPALGGITIEAAEREEAERRPGIDIPLQSAPLARRLVAALVDGLIIAAASALFGFIFWKVAAVQPPLIQIAGLAVGMTCLFWAAYQYLLVVYAATTPGLRAAGLELARFEGTLPKRRLRRWRVLASYLSAVSLGMGYAWVFLDEDALCWHDRITHTYLAPIRSEGKGIAPTP